MLIHWVLIQIGGYNNLGTMAVYIKRLLFSAGRPLCDCLKQSRLPYSWIMDTWYFGTGFSPRLHTWWHEVKKPRESIFPLLVSILDHFLTMNIGKLWVLYGLFWAVLLALIESEIDPKKRICYFVFYGFDPIPSCCLRFVFLDGELNTWSSVRRGTRTSEIRINEPR